MTPFTTELPAAICNILDARLTTTQTQHCLHLRLGLRGLVRREVVLAATLTDLLYQLTSQLGFNSADAGQIINLAQGGN